MAYATKFNYVLQIQSTAEQYIPEPPSPPLDSDIGSEIVEQLTALGEPTLQSLGLASLYPSGLIQRGLEALHVGLDIPWWTSVVLGNGLQICLFKEKKCMTLCYSVNSNRAAFYEVGITSTEYM